MDTASQLQHPRRNLGSRHRAQSERFVKLAKADAERFDDNLAWAEQNAQQSVLYDYTDERNWRQLANVKQLAQDESGLRAVLEDAFIVLGRDSENLIQLSQINMLEMGYELLCATLTRDPLDADTWWEGMDSSTLEEFAQRCKSLDFTDQRANIIYGRRLERIRLSGDQELFVELVQHLLAHRPANHELWLELGRLYERRGEMDEAWLCYDHVQQLRPQTPVRDEFLARLRARMDGEESKPWSEPALQQRNEFLSKMQQLSSRTSKVVEVEETSEEVVNIELERLRTLLDSEDFSEAFFLARRLVTEGDDWAKEYLDRAREGLGV